VAALAATLVVLGCRSESTPSNPQDAASNDGHAKDGGPGDVGQSEGGPGQSPFSIFHSAPHGETLHAITGWDSNHFMAVGDSQVTYVFTEGKLSRTGGDVAGSDFQAVWGSSPTDVFAAGALAAGGGFVAHYDGSAWKTVFKSPTRLYGIWGTLAEEEGILAVGEKGILYGSVAGGSWQMEATLPVNPDAPDAAMSSNSPILSAISGRNASDFTITSNGAEFFHYEPDAGGLVYYQPELDPNTNFTAVWQDPDASGTSAYVGSNFYGLYYFTSPDTPTDASVIADGSGGYVFGQITADPKANGAKGLALHGIWGTAEKVVAVGDDAYILAVDLSSGHTGVVSAPAGAKGTFGGIWGSSLADIWIVGPDETILHGSLQK
jgi:hypothetical protein